MKEIATDLGWCRACATAVLLAATCYWCRVRPPNLRDLDTSFAWCFGCASATVHKGDPILCFEELDDSAAYARLLRARGYRRRGTPEPPDGNLL